jgi:hypothetical protein
MHVGRPVHICTRTILTLQSPSNGHRVSYNLTPPGSTRQRKAVVTATGWRRRRLCQVSRMTLGKGNSFAECLPSSTRQRKNLCRVPPGHSTKNPPGRVPMSGSLPSATYGTRQSVPLCWVSETLHSAKNIYRCPGLGSLPSAMVLTLGKEPLCRVLHSAKWPVCTFFICFL